MALYCIWMGIKLQSFFQMSLKERNNNISIKNKQKGVMPVGRRHTDKVLRLMVSAQNDHLPLSVTFEEPINYSKVSNWHLGIRKIQMLKLIQIG